MNTKINPEYLKEDELEIRVFSDNPTEQKILDKRNSLILEKGIKTIKNNKEIKNK